MRVVEFVGAAWRTPVRPDPALDRFDTALRPAELGAFVAANNEQVDDVLGEDGAKDLESGFDGQVEEWAVWTGVGRAFD